MDEILERLRIAREQAGLSQGQVAALLGMESAATISHYESGLRGLHVETLLKLCEIYDVAPVWVMTGVNPDFDAQAFIETVGASSKDLRRVLGMLESVDWRRGQR